MAAINKIAATSPSRQTPSELETSIAGALYDLETNNTDMKSALRPLQFVSAREVSQCSQYAGKRGVRFTSLAENYLSWCATEDVTNCLTSISVTFAHYCF